MVFTTNHKETLSLPSPQVSWILVSTHLSILSLPTHASVLSDPNSAPTASPKLLLLRLYWPPCCKSQRKFFSPHLNLPTQSTTPSFLKHSLLLYSMIVCSFSQLLQSTLPSDKHSSGPGPGVNLLLWLHLLLISTTPIFLSLAKASLFCVSGLLQSQAQLPVLCFIFNVSDGHLVSSKQFIILSVTPTSPQC